MVFLTHKDKDVIARAVELIKEIAEDMEIGKVFDAKITRVEKYGVFITCSNGKGGLIHVSNIGQ